MSNIPENLGRTVPWQIRDIPEGIRDAVTEQARAEKVNVAEFLTRLVLDAREAGWSFSASNMFANLSNTTATTPDPGPSIANFAELAATCMAVAKEAKIPVPEQLGKDALNTLRLALRQARGLPPPQRKKPQLAMEGQPSADAEAKRLAPPRRASPQLAIDKDSAS